MSDPITEAGTREERRALKAQLVAEAKSELKRWAKRRLWVASVVLGSTTVVGLYIVLRETVENTLESLLEERVEKVADRFEETLRDMTKQIGETETTTRYTTEAAQDARRSASEAVTAANTSIAQLADLQTRASDTDRRISEMEGAAAKSLDHIDAAKRDFDEIRGRLNVNWPEVYATAYTAASDTAVQRAVGDLRFAYLENRVNEIEHLLAEVQPASEGPRELIDAFVKAATDQFKNYSDGLRQLKANSELKVMFYVSRSDDALYTEAQQASARLQALGYRTDVWLANGGDEKASRDDIAKEFPGAASVLGSSNAGVVVAPSQVDHGEQIRQALSDVPLFGGIDLIEANAKPATVHLKRAQRSDYQPDQIVLVFRLSESMTR